MKKIINSPETFVIEMCKGIAKAHPELEFVEKYKLIKKKNINPDKVSLISGGGSGHEPAHAGYVGTGMLDCAVCGDIFASPSQIQVYNAIKECATDKGVLLVIKNYSGDCMNFNNAATLAREEDGIKVDAVYVTDDIAVKDSLYTVGRRGVAGTVFVHKIAGAMAEKGASLEEVVRVANKVIENVKTFGFALTSCTPPAKGTPIFDISDTDMEFGVGIHGEPGRKTEKIQSADELAKRIVADLLDELKGNKSKDVAVIINGFGATPLMELYLLNNSVSNELEKAKQIFNYLTTEVQYDYKILEDPNAGNIEPYAYYLEGAILAQSAVCDGKSKAYVLLLAMAGIESKRVTAKDYDGNGHAYNYVKINEKWYLSCTTYGQVNDRYKQIGFKDSLIYSRYNMFLTNKYTELGKDDNGNNAWKYVSLKHYDIYEKIEKEEFGEIRDKFHDWDDLKKYLDNNMSTILEMYRNGKYPQYIAMQIELLTQYSNDTQLKYETTNVAIRILKNRSNFKHTYTCIFRFD